MDPYVFAATAATLDVVSLPLFQRSSTMRSFSDRGGAAAMLAALVMVGIVAYVFAATAATLEGGIKLWVSP